MDSRGYVRVPVEEPVGLGRNDFVGETVPEVVPELVGVFRKDLDGEFVVVPDVVAVQDVWPVVEPVPELVGVARKVLVTVTDVVPLVVTDVVPVPELVGVFRKDLEGEFVVVPDVVAVQDV